MVKVVLRWLLEYSCKNKYAKVLKRLSCNKEWSSLSQLEVPHIHHALCVLHDVMSSRNVEKFELAQRLVKHIMSVGQDLVPCDHFVRIISGLRTLVLFHHLRKNDKLILAKLNNYFPRSGVSLGNLPPKLEDSVNTAHLNFRRFFLSLLASEKRTKKYFHEHYEQDFGESFQAKVMELVDGLLSKLEANLPQTQIDKIFSWGLEVGSLEQLMQTDGHVATETLLQAMHGKERLSEDEVLRILDVILGDCQKEASKLQDQRKHQGRQIVAETTHEGSEDRHYVVMLKDSNDAGPSHDDSRKSTMKTDSGDHKQGHTTRHLKSRSLSSDLDSEDDTVAPRKKRKSERLLKKNCHKSKNDRRRRHKEKGNSGDIAATRSPLRTNQKVNENKRNVKLSRVYRQKTKFPDESAVILSSTQVDQNSDRLKERDLESQPVYDGSYIVISSGSSGGQSQGGNGEKSQESKSSSNTSGNSESILSHRRPHNSPRKTITKTSIRKSGSSSRLPVPEEDTAGITTRRDDLPVHVGDGTSPLVIEETPSDDEQLQSQCAIMEAEQKPTSHQEMHDPFSSNHTRNPLSKGLETQDSNQWFTAPTSPMSMMSEDIFANDDPAYMLEKENDIKTSTTVIRRPCNEVVSDSEESTDFGSFSTERLCDKFDMVCTLPVSAIPPVPKLEAHLKSPLCKPSIVMLTPLKLDLAENCRVSSDGKIFVNPRSDRHRNDSETF